ncbi:BTB/POZ domain-containing protein 6-like [Oculina patagonica]
MSTSDENWQMTTATIRERGKFLLNNELLSDVTFVVETSDGEDDNKKRKMAIPAHKFILSMSSPVFFKMFYGEMAETSDSIDLPDCEYEGLLELLRYIYSDEAKLNGENVMQVLYLAKKYMLPSLADQCTEYLRKTLGASNVFVILQNARLHEEKFLELHCWDVIDKQTEDVVKSDEFSSIERSLLEEVVERDTLSIQEVELFKAVDNWATKACERQSLDPSGTTKRQVLGDRVFKALRFPAMEQSEFASVVLDVNLLTPVEVFDMMKYFSSVLTTPVGFPEVKRANRYHLYHRCGRFDSVEAASWRYTMGRTDSIGVKVDKDVMLHGVCLFGSIDGVYSANVRIARDDGQDNFWRSSDRPLPLTATNLEQLQCELVRNASHSYCGFYVMFDQPVLLSKDLLYSVQASISGMESWSGKNGSKSVECAGVTFHFDDAGGRPSGNGTTISHGQIAEFLFMLK